MAKPPSLPRPPPPQPLAQGIKGEAAPHPRACTSAQSTSAAGGPACRARWPGALLSHSAWMGLSGAWLMPSPSSGGRALPCWPPLFFLPGLQASQCSHGPSAGFSQSSPFPIMGPEQGGGLLLFRGSPAPLTHTRCWLSRASPGHNGPRGVCSQPPPPQGQHWHHRASASRYCPPGLQKDESCSLLLLLLPQQPSHLLC